MCHFFIFATGATGDTGPTGPAIATAFGGLSNDTQTITLATGSSPYTIELGTTLPAENVTYSPADSITVSEAGTYQISYNSNISTTDASDSITIAVNNGGTPIPSTSVTDTIASGTPVNYNGTVFADLEEGAELNLQITTDASSGTLTVDNASLNVLKIS